MQTIKCVVVGDGDGGKTALIRHYAGEGFDGDPYYAYGSFMERTVTSLYKGTPISLVVQDTPGQEDYDRLRPLFYPDTDVLLVCFHFECNIFPRASFENVPEKWVPEITHYCPNTPFLLVGLKVDLKDDPGNIKQFAKRGERPITTEEGQALAAKLGAAKYMECSSKAHKGVDEVFNEAIQVALSCKLLNPALCMYLQSMGSCVNDICKAHTAKGG